MSRLQGSRTQPFPEIPAEQIPEQFTVKQSKTMLVLGLVLIFVIGAAAVQSVMTAGLTESANMLVASVIAVAAGAVVLVKYKNHRLEVNGEELTYTDIFGHTSRFHASEIASARQDVSENPKLFSADGQLLARFERNMENFPLMIAYLKARNVTAN
jgi:hypothetical protein